MLWTLRPLGIALHDAQRDAWNVHRLHLRSDIGVNRLEVSGLQEAAVDEHSTQRESLLSGSRVLTGLWTVRSSPATRVRRAVARS